MNNNEFTISCSVCQDLIPLVLDHVASKDSEELVHNHIAGCAICNQCYNNTRSPEDSTSCPDDKRVLKKIRRTVYTSMLVFILIGGLFGVAITNGSEVFYNSILMPVVGGLSYLVFRKHWYIPCLSLTIITYLWIFITSWIDEGFSTSLFMTPLFFTIIYAILLLIGVVIAELLTFAFKKEDMVEKKVDHE